MRDVEKKACLLCQREAKFYWVDHGDKKYFDCPNCKRYMISYDDEKFVSEAIEENKNRVAEFASKASESEVTVIAREATSKGQEIKFTYELKKGLPI